MVEFADLLPVGVRALDLACGAGRDSVFLAERGLHVIGIDRSCTALEQGRELARQKRVPVGWIQADLENFAFPSSAFEVITCFYYRDPKMYASIRESLRPGGVVLYETFSREQLRFESGPRNAAHLLDSGELLSAFADWKVIFYRETWIEQGTALLIARKPTAKYECRL